MECVRLSGTAKPPTFACGCLTIYTSQDKLGYTYRNSPQISMLQHSNIYLSAMLIDLQCLFTFGWTVVFLHNVFSGSQAERAAFVYSIVGSIVEGQRRHCRQALCVFICESHTTA